MKHKLIWHTSAWEDYLYWQFTDKKMLKKINALIQEIDRDPFVGTGKPEPLQHHLKGLWSRRIDLEHRLLYTVEGDTLVITGCRYHYR